MKFIVNFIFLILLLAARFRPVLGSGGDGVQVFTLSSGTEIQLQAEFQRLKSAGIDRIMFRCFKNPGDTPFALLPERAETGVYFDSVREPVVSDLLPVIVRTAHARGLECHGWITSRKSMWILREHPEWEGSRHAIESRTQIPSGQLDIFEPAVQERLAAMYAELAATGVDGILIQDDFVSRQGDDLESRAWKAFAGREIDSGGWDGLFQTGSGHVKYRPLFHRWAFYKSRILAGILGRMIRELKIRVPGIAVSANIYYETVISPGLARLWLAQDLEALLETPVDRLAVMAYQDQMAVELGIPVETALNLLDRGRRRWVEGYLIPENSLLWKIQIADWNRGTPVDRRHLPRESSTSGLARIWVPYRGLDSLEIIYGAAELP